MRFIRAFYYFILTQVYGDVVLSLKPLGKDSSDYQLPRTPRAIVTDTILSDLNFAINNLPDTAYSGHAVKATALGYLAKVYLANQRWQDAAATAQLIMSSNKFSLYKGGIVFLPSQAGSASGFLNKKGVDSTRATVIQTQSDQDWVYLRYAEILLIYAEAQNEAVGPDASVYSAINQIRERPGVNMPDLPAGLSQDSMRTRIRHERRIELAMEGQRYFDLKRWKLDRVILPTIHDPGTTPINGPLRTFPLRDTLWPVPQAEMDIAKSYNNVNFKQTSGYN